MRQAARARAREDKFIPKPRVRDDEAARARENPDVVNVEDDDDATELAENNREMNITALLQPCPADNSVKENPQEQC